LVKKIVITGPESSGKTTLASLLAKEYNTTWLKEYAREYLEQINRPYELKDVLIMAKKQLKLEENSTSELTILDTDLTIYAIWIKEKYNQEIDWITAHLKTANDKLYLLCDVDIEWEEDELREHPNIEDRQRLFEDYKNLLKKHQLSYHIISGDIPTRLKKCREIIG
jgi:nicotinamide riboside kinase